MTETESAVPVCECGQVKFRTNGAYVCRHCDRGDCPYALSNQTAKCERHKAYEKAMKAKIDKWYVYK